MIINSENILDIMSDAVEKKDEPLMKKIILEAMNFFITDENFTKENLNEVASSYLQTLLSPEGEFDFKDRKLRYVLEELTIIEEKTDSRAKEVVKNCKLYLEDKPYV